MPAALTIGISTGVRIRIVGVMSSAVPTITTRTCMAIMSSIGLSMNGFSSAVTCPGSSAIVMSQADTSAAATRNMTIAVVSAAVTNTR